MGAKPATIERRLVTLKSYYAWREDRNSALPSPFADVRISVRIPRRLPRPIDRDVLRAVLQTGDEPSAVRSKEQEGRVVITQQLCEQCITDLEMSPSPQAAVAIFRVSHPRRVNPKGP